MHGDADVETCAAKIELRNALLAAYGVRHIDLLRAQALRDAHAPFAAYYRSRLRRLREDVPGGHVARVIAVIHIKIQPHSGGLAARLFHGHSLERGHLHLSAVDGEVHGGDGRQQPYGRQQHQQRGHAEGCF